MSLNYICNDKIKPNHVFVEEKGGFTLFFRELFDGHFCLLYLSLIKEDASSYFIIYDERTLMVFNSLQRRMNKTERIKHWEHIYQTKKTENVSWYQAVPGISLNFIKQHNILPSARIIDVGAGDSFLVDNLLDMGFNDITVLDISNTALERVKQRIGDQSGKVKWIEADVAAFMPEEKYDVWHDRAAFHFLTEESDITNYLTALQRSLNPGGIFIVGVFSVKGPKMCSGLNIRQYSEEELTERLAMHFRKIQSISVDHKTPFDTLQNFIFSCFERI